MCVVVYWEGVTLSQEGRGGERGVEWSGDDGMDRADEGLGNVGIYRAYVHIYVYVCIVPRCIYSTVDSLYCR